MLGWPSGLWSWDSSCRAFAIFFGWDFGLQQHSVSNFFRHPVEHEKGVVLRPKDIFEESLGIPGRRDQFSDRCGDGETNRDTVRQNTHSVHLENVILKSMNS